VLVTLQRHAKARGYFSPERFTGRVEHAAVRELAMNPDSFTGAPTKEYYPPSPMKWRMSGSIPMAPHRAAPFVPPPAMGREAARAAQGAKR